MTIDLEDLGNGSAKPGRLTGKYRGARRENLARDETGNPSNLGGGLEPAGLELVGPPELPPSPLDSGGLSEPLPAMGESLSAMDYPALPAESLVEHPLLRGLLLELPPRGSAPPSQEWLDRWFEAARSILELLYVQETVRPR